ncbi:MAG: hypothetical protein ACHQ1D_00100 [Nitrososphaerales archaeon]
MKPKGDNRYAEASRKAMRIYASHIESINPELCKQLRQWADEEHFKVTPTPEDFMKNSD